LVVEYFYIRYIMKYFLTDRSLFNEPKITSVKNLWIECISRVLQMVIEFFYVRYIVVKCFLTDRSLLNEPKLPLSKICG